MSLQFYLGASGSGKSYQLHKNILSEAKDNPSVNYLFIVPDQFTLSTQQDLVNESECGGIMNIDVLSFSRLSHRVFEELGCNNELVLDDTGKNLIVRHLSRELKDEMVVLGDNLNKIGYEHEIKSIISEFKQYSITSDTLNAIIEHSESKGMLCQKLKDIKVIYEAFDEYIKDRFITSEDTITLLSNRLNESNVVKNAVVILDGFTGFTPVQYRLIQGLLALTTKVIVSVTIDIESEPFKMGAEQELFYLSKKTIRDLQRIAQEINVREDESILLNESFRFKNNAELYHLERSIFRYPEEAFDGKCDSISITEALNPLEEIKLCCMNIKDLVMHSGYQYRDIAVVCGNLSAYSELMKEYSDMLDIPVFIDETRAIRLNPFVEYIKSALNLIKENYSYNSVFHFLRSGMLDMSLDEIDRLDNYVIKCGIKGKSTWNKAFTKVPYPVKGGEGVDSQNIDALLKLNESREKIVDILSPISNKKATVTEFVEALYEFILRTNAKDKLDQWAADFRTKNDEEKAKEYEQIYGRIIALLDQLHELLPDEMLIIDDFIKLFESGIDEIDIGTIPGGIDKVMVGDIERSRIGRVKVLMFLGVNDGNIPKNNQKGGIISDFDREFLHDVLKDTNIELSPSPREQLFSQRLYLYLNMTKPSDRLYISYSRSDGAGKSLRESYVVGHIKALFPSVEVIKSSKDIDWFSMVNAPVDALGVLSKALRECSESNKFLEDKDSDEDYKDRLLALFNVLAGDSAYETEIYKLVDTAFFEYKDEALSKELSKIIYDEVLKNSVSRLERFSSCQYAHFMQYGMHLFEREEFSFENTDLGNVYHSLLQSFANALSNKGYTLADYPDEEGEEILHKLLTDESATYGGAILRSNATNEYKLNKIYDIVLRTLKTTKKQLQAGKFIPAGFEQGFVEEIKLDDNRRMKLRGKIDRIDICQDDDRLYVKIVDYKSSPKEIELDSLFYGLQMQQSVYMMSAIREMSRKYPDITPVMAAMLYYHINDPVISGDSDMDKDKVESMIENTLRPNGMVLNDDRVISNLDSELINAGAKSSVVPVAKNKDGSYSANSKLLSAENYELINNYTLKKIKEIGNSILDGNIALSPSVHGDKDSCQYCAYKDICKFDPKLKGYTKKSLKKMKNEEALELMKEEV